MSFAIDTTRVNSTSDFQFQSIYLAKCRHNGDLKTVIVTHWDLEHHKYGVIFITEDGTMTHGSLEYLEGNYEIVSKVNKLILE